MARGLPGFSVLVRTRQCVLQAIRLAADRLADRILYRRPREPVETSILLGGLSAGELEFRRVHLSAFKNSSRPGIKPCYSNGQRASAIRNRVLQSSQPRRLVFGVLRARPKMGAASSGKRDTPRNGGSSGLL